MTNLGRILFIGDSANVIGETKTYGKFLQESLRTDGYDCYNVFKNISGQNSAGLLNAKQLWNKTKPIYTIVNIGANDSEVVDEAPVVSLEDFEANLTAICEEIETFDCNKVILCGAWHAVDTFEATHPDYWTQYSPATATIANTFGFTYVNLATLWTSAQQATYLVDGIHLNDTGAALVAETIKPYLLN